MKTDPGLIVQSERESPGRRRRGATRKTGRSCRRRSRSSKQKAAERTAVTEAFLKKHGLAGAEKVRDAAVKFCLGHPGVHTVCPSINSFEALEAFVRLSGQKLEIADESTLADCREAYGDSYCRHACGLCEASCPAGVSRQHHHALRVLLRGEGAAEGGHGPLRCSRRRRARRDGVRGLRRVLRGLLPVRSAHPGEASALPRGPDALTRRRRSPRFRGELSTAYHDDALDELYGGHQGDEEQREEDRVTDPRREPGRETAGGGRVERPRVVPSKLA